MGRSATTSGSPMRTRRQKLLWSPVGIVLVLLMAAGSVLMWIGLPLGLIWLASALTDSSQPSMGPYLLILIGLPVGLFAIGKALGALDRAHGGITRRLAAAQLSSAWIRGKAAGPARRSPAAWSSAASIPAPRTPATASWRAAAGGSWRSTAARSRRPRASTGASGWR